MDELVLNISADALAPVVPKAIKKSGRWIDR